MIEDPIGQCLGNGFAGRVCYVQHAAVRVAAFAGEVQFVAELVEADASRLELMDGRCRMGNGEFDDLLVAQPRAGNHRVVYVRRHAIVGIGNGSDPALRPVGRTRFNLALAQHRYARIRR